MRIPPRLSPVLVRLCSAVLVLHACAASAADEQAAPGQADAQGVRLQAVGTDGRGHAAAVVVHAGALVHTASIHPLDASGRLQGPGDAAAQAAHVLGSLDRVLRAAGSGLDRIARLHVYVADATVTPSVDRLLADRFAGARIAVTLVESKMPHAGVLVAMDAIAATARPAGPAERIAVTGLASPPGDAAHAAVQPDGPFVIVSGRAAPGEFDAAVRATMEQLRGDLNTVELAFEHVVQVKAFLGDMTRAARLQQIVAATFDGTAPPLVVTEWRDAPVPVEIELVATASGANGGGERLVLVEPIMARYSRIARIFEGRPILVSGMGGSSAEPAVQTREMFEGLRRVLEAAGSDMRHIAKATYYVSDKAADQEINAIRPSIYDPARPPAASKISVQGTGVAGRMTIMDAIAVTTGR